MQPLITSLLLCALWLTAAASQHPAHAQDDAAAHINSVLMTQFDRPDSRLTVGPVVVAADHAIAGWTQGDMGGRALLRRKGHDWQIVLCSGDQLKSADTLVKVGLPQSAAKALAGQLAAAEAKVDPARLSMLARFDGIVMMDQHGHHPPQHSPQHAPHHK